MSELNGMCIYCCKAVMECDCYPEAAITSPPPSRLTDTEQDLLCALEDIRLICQEEMDNICPLNFHVIYDKASAAITAAMQQNEKEGEVKQGEIITAPNATGTFWLQENNNGLYPPNLKTPKLIIHQPAWIAEIENAGVNQPAQSMEVADVKALYLLLKNYYETA